MIVLDSVIRANKKYYPQTILEECKILLMENLINGDLDLSSSVNETDNETDNGSDNGSDNDEKIFINHI